MGSRAFKIRDYKSGDEHRILDLYQEAYGKRIDIHRWRWIYDSKNTHSIIVLAESRDGLIGHVSGLVKTIVYQDHEFKAVHSLYAVVRSKVRRSGLFIEMMRRLESHAMDLGADFIYGFSYHNYVFRALNKIGRKKIGVIPLYVLPIHPLKLSSLKVPIANKISFVDNTTRNIVSILAQSWPTTPITNFKEVHEALWLNNRPENKFAVLRNKDYMDWRYTKWSGAGYRLMSLSESTELDGFLIFRVEEKWGVKVVFIMDIVIPYNNVEGFDKLLGGVVDFALNAKADAITAMGVRDDMWTARLVSKGFIKVPQMFLPRVVGMTLKPLKDKPILEKAMDINNWYLSWGDTHYV